MDTNELQTLTECRAAATAARAQAEQILFESTEKKLERNRLLQTAIQERRAALERELSKVKHASSPGERENELWEMIKRAKERECFLFNDVRGLPARLIKPNAVADGEAELAERKAKLPKRPDNAHTTLGPRLNKEIQEYETDLHEWNVRFKKFAELGEQIYKLRSDIEAWSKERDELRLAREERVMENSGLV